MEKRIETLQNLSLVHPMDFFDEHSARTTADFDDSFIGGDEPRRVKLASNEQFQATTLALKNNVFKGVAHSPVILGNAGGSDSIISLYANLAETVGEGHSPHVVVADWSNSKIQYMMFRLGLAQLGDTKEDYMVNLLGLDGTDYQLSAEKFEDIELKPKIKREIELWVESNPKYKPDSFDVLYSARETKLKKEEKKRLAPLKKQFPQKLLESVVDKEYDAKEHLRELRWKIESNIKDPRMEQLMLKIAQMFTSHLEKDDNYKKFIEYMKTSVSKNPKTHYLTSDDLFQKVRDSFNLSRNNMKFNWHFMETNMFTSKGIAEVKEMLTKTGLWEKGYKPLTLAYVPNLMRSESLITYFRDNTDFAISCIRTNYGQRKWMPRESHDLPIFRPKKRRSDLAKEVRANLGLFSSLAVEEDLDGLPKTMFLAGLNLGSEYSDEETLAKYISIANHTGIEHIVIGGAVSGLFHFHQNERRMVQKEDMRFLDDQLKALNQIITSFNGKVTVVPSDGENHVYEDLFDLYFWEKRRRAGDTRIARTASGGLLLDRDAYNMVNDTARTIIKEDLIPYLIRLGKDATTYFDDFGEGNYLIELIDAIERYKRLRDEGNLDELPVTDRNLLNIEKLEDSEKLRVVYELSETFEKEDGSAIGLRVKDNTLFSRVTQYVNAVQGLSFISDIAANGSIKTIKEQIIVDGRQAYQWLKATNDQILMSLPHMDDDSKYHDPEFIPARKKVLADPVHKRNTIRKIPNHPGSFILTGDHRYKMNIEMFFPRVLEVMERIQKEGRGERDISIALIQDWQLGSLTEFLNPQVKFMDYAFHARDCIGAFAIGDLIQGRNYHDMPNENRWLGGTTVEDQQLGCVRMQMPFFRLPQVEFWDVVEGNHEWNTDKMHFGINFLTPLQAAIEMHNLEKPEHNLDSLFPVYAIVPENGKGQLMKARYGYRQIGDYGVIFGHKFSERGAGKGSGKFPSTHMTSWVRQMGELAKPFDILLAGHYHGLEMAVSDNKMGIVCPSFAGESGYEFARQYGGNKPMGAILHKKADGRVTIEIVTDTFLEDYRIQSCVITKAGGLDNFIYDCFTMEATILGPGVSPGNMKQMYRREIEPKKGRIIR